MNGRIALSDVAARAEVLAIACNRCDRAGRYPVATLIARYGAACSIPGLLRVLSKDCPKREPQQGMYDLCGINCPDLPALFRV